MLGENLKSQNEIEHNCWLRWPDFDVELFGKYIWLEQIEKKTVVNIQTKKLDGKSNVSVADLIQKTLFSNETSPFLLRIFFFGWPIHCCCCCCSSLLFLMFVYFWLGSMGVWLCVVCAVFLGILRVTSDCSSMAFSIVFRTVDLQHIKWLIALASADTTESEAKRKAEHTKRKTDEWEWKDKIGKRRENKEKMSELLNLKIKRKIVCATARESVVKEENEHKNKLIKWK